MEQLDHAKEQSREPDQKDLQTPKKDPSIKSSSSHPSKAQVSLNYQANQPPNSNS